MKNWVCVSIIVLTLNTGCQKENLSPEPPSISLAGIRFAQQLEETGYQVEGRIPWEKIGKSAKEGDQIGFELFVVDDDDGGLKDHKLSEFLEDYTLEKPSPAQFGTFTLVEEATGQGPDVIAHVAAPLTIDGRKESLWETAPIRTLSHALVGSPTTSTDISGQFQVLWDSAALYVWIQVQDEELVTDSRALSWEDDGISIYLDPDLQRPKELDEEVIFSFRVLPTQEGVQINQFPNPPDWTLPVNEILDGGPGQDGIPALENPAFISAQEATYLREGDMVIGWEHNGIARAYPHRILDWHEIVNDRIQDFPFSVTYCPLTGTASGWQRTIGEIRTTFGVSGLLYNTNLMPYDRLTGSTWSQIQLECVEGPNQGRKARTFPLVETPWETWKSMYPETQVLAEETGFDRNYSVYPYGDYRTNDEYLIFPVNPDDDRLPRKARVHAVIVNQTSRVYRLSRMSATGISLIHDQFQGKPVIVAGSKGRNFAVSFYRNLADGTILSFSEANSLRPSVIMQDQEGNEWDAFGRAIEGPRKGTQLTPTESMIGYWFAIASFYPDAEIY